MKVNIGPYKNWFGPHQLAKHFGKLGFSDDFIDALGYKIPEAPFTWFSKKIKGARKIEVTIHDYDTWGMDTTLAYIVLPMLKQLKATKQGSPFVDDVDVPDHLKATNAPPKENEWDTDGFHHDRWEYVLDEMINSFQCIIGEDDPAESWEDKYFVDGNFDKEGYAVEAARIAKGFELFGKYYQGLWD